LYSEIGKAQDDLEKAQHDLKKGYEELEERMRDFSEIQSQFLERVRSSTNTTQTRGDSEGKQPDVDKS
jgi:hypothetical protein